MEYTYKAIQDYFYNNNLHASDTIYNDMDSIAHVLCEVLTSSEKARAKKAVKNGGFFTFGYNGLYYHCRGRNTKTEKGFMVRLNRLAF